jgi:hypothetical protein
LYKKKNYDMANNVTNIIKIIATEEAIKSIDDRFDLAGGYAETHTFVKAFYDNPQLTENGAVLNAWSYDNVGCKWIYVENNIDEGEWNIQSASYPPHEFLQRLFELVTEIDPDGYIENRYTDESYSPIGVMVFKKDDVGPKWSEIVEYDMVDPTDDMEFDDEGYEEAREGFMNDIYNFHEESIEICLETISLGEGENFKLLQSN